MKNQIRALPSDVVDQIAAGEVVERPAHLVKELVENALDAGARSIEVEYDQGGRRIRVTDDGHGIAIAELGLALARHATSKISASDDLWSLSTFGFRGEALASAASVSRFTLLSRPPGATAAARVVADFGKIGRAEECGGNVGTTALVEDLFANVPARLKFLKSESGETTQIKNVLKALALSRPDVEFRGRSRGKVDFFWPKASTAVERAGQILGLGALYESHGDAGTVRARAIFASPHEVSGQSRSIWIFAQGRWVQDRGLQAAVLDAFRGLLMHGEYPIAVVDVRTDVGEIDVNIHPTKSQVKFRDAQSAFRAVHRAVRGGLEKAPWLETLGAGEAPRVASVAAAVEAYSARPPAPAPAPSLAFAGPGFDDVRFKHSSFVPEPPPEAAPAAGAWSRLQLIGQLKLTYVVAQSDQAMVLVDQHAAHERVAFERLMRGWAGGRVDRQALLFPLSMALSSDGVEALNGAREDLERLGVTLEPSSPHSLAIRAKPAAISDAALLSALARLAQEITEKGGGFALERRIGDVCASLACHSVVRAGQALSREQMQSLLQQMDEFPLSSFCPHGRPVSVEVSFAKLDRDFGRIV